MLSYKQRFHGYNALRYVYKNGTATRAPLITLKVIENTHRSDSRVAVVVSKKISKKATDRNRIRRRLYEIFRQEVPKFVKTQDIACIVTSSDVGRKSASDLRDDVIALIETAGLYK